MHGLSKDRRLDETSDDGHYRHAYYYNNNRHDFSIKKHPYHDRDHRGTDTEYRHEVYQGRDKGKDQRVVIYSCRHEDQISFSSSNNEQCHITAKYAEDRHGEVVDETKDPVPELSVRCIPCEELENRGTVIDKVEAAQHDADDEEDGVRKISNEIPDLGKRCADERRNRRDNVLADAVDVLLKRSHHFFRDETAVRNGESLKYGLAHRSTRVEVHRC